MIENGCYNIIIVLRLISINKFKNVKNICWLILDNNFSETRYSHTYTTNVNSFI